MIKTDGNKLYYPIVHRIKPGKGRHIYEIDIVQMVVFHRDVVQARIFGETHSGVYFLGRIPSTFSLIVLNINI